MRTRTTKCMGPEHYRASCDLPELPTGTVSLFRSAVAGQEVRQRGTIGWDKPVLKMGVSGS